MQEKGVCLSHVPKYHWLPGLGMKGRNETKAMLRSLARTMERDNSNGRAVIAETVSLLGGG